MKDEVSDDLDSVVNIQSEMHNIGIKATNLCLSPCGKLLSVYLQKTVSFYSLDKDLSESVFSQSSLSNSSSKSQQSKSLCEIQVDDEILSMEWSTFKEKAYLVLTSKSSLYLLYNYKIICKKTDFSSPIVHCSVNGDCQMISLLFEDHSVHLYSIEGEQLLEKEVLSLSEADASFDVIQNLTSWTHLMTAHSICVLYFSSNNVYGVLWDCVDQVYSCLLIVFLGVQTNLLI